MGNNKSARPDFRYAFYGEEVVFDITTPMEANKGHLLNKSIGPLTINNHPRIPIAVEVVWEDSDFIL